MIATLRVNNSSFANLGSVHVQPLVQSVVTQATNQTTTTHPSSLGVLPTHEVSLLHPILLPSLNNIERFSTPSLLEIGQHLISGNPIVLPLLTRFNTVLPTYQLQLDAGKAYDPRLNSGFTTTTAKFQPYEQLTGIAQERPEVIMMTNFEPLFNRDVIHTAPHYITAFDAAGLDPYMTDAGRFLDAQMQMRNLRSHNSQALVKTLKSRYAKIEQEFSSRTNTLQNALNSLSENSSFLLNLVRIIEAQKSQLDLRHDIYTVDPSQVGSLLQANYTQATVSAKPTTSKMKKVIPLHLSNFHPLQFNAVDSLSELGYKAENLRNIYSSSKIWMQLVLELSYALKFHTLPFLDIDPSYQRNDTNPTTILNPNVTRFALSTNLPNLPPLSELVALQPSLIAQTINAINPAFTSIYQNVLFKDEEARIAALANLLSMEFRYSFGLTGLPLKRMLQGVYNYTVTSGQANTTLFDSVLGQFGNNITDFPSQANSALTSVAQQVAGSTGVLTFESKYVEGDTGTLTPGGDFYFDQLLQTDGQAFNTGNIDQLVGVLDNAFSSFNIVSDAMNLLQKPYVDVVSADAAKLVEGSILNTTVDLLNSIKSPLVDASGQTSKMLQDDRLASVFSLARQDNNVKSALFLYVISKISRSYNMLVPFFSSPVTADNTPLVDALVIQINIALQNALPRSRTNVQSLSEPGFDPFRVNNSSALNPSGIATALKAGTPLTNYVITIMGEIIDRFRSTQAFNGGVSVYGGYLDTVVAMVAFDLVISAIARYGNLSLTGVTYSGFNLFFQDSTSYVVSQTSIDHLDSVNELMSRASQENVRIQRLVMCILNIMQTLSGSLKGISNYLKTPVATQTLQQVAGILGDRKQLLSMLLSEQQIMMLAATTTNLIRAATQDIPPLQRIAQADVDSTHELKILDESDVPPAMRSAIYGYLGTAEFSSARGQNKRILTVGIPQGFTQRIKQKVNIQQQNRASFTNRRNDIVQVCVYKVDMVNGDIIYKPQRFLFEMSRFSVRSATGNWLPLPDRPSLHDIVNSIPTMDFSQNANTSTSQSIVKGVEYASAVVAQNDGLKNVSVALNDDSYSFMTTQQKAELLQNHVVSQILEAYIKLMTGINVAEYNFDMANIPRPLDASFVKTLTEHVVAHIADMVQAKAVVPATNSTHPTAPVGGLLFSTTALASSVAPKGSVAPLAISQPKLSNPAGVAGFSSLSSQVRSIQPATTTIKTLAQSAVVGNLETNLATITPRNVPLVLENMRTISGLSYTLTSASDPSALNQKVVVPKQFDRVFNLIVDPADFEVDVEQTTQTPYGREALSLMVGNGEIISMTENDDAAFNANPIADRTITPGSRPFTQGRAASNVNRFRYRDRDISEGDLIADKYFITIETFDEGT